MNDDSDPDELDPDELDRRVVPLPRKDGVRRRCPICSRPAVHRFRPFCSQRCADIDLGRWVKGSYAIPTEEAPEGEPSVDRRDSDDDRSEEHTSELQSLMRISYADFGLKKKKNGQDKGRQLITHNHN